MESGSPSFRTHTYYYIVPKPQKKESLHSGPNFHFIRVINVGDSAQSGALHYGDCPLGRRKL